MFTVPTHKDATGAQAHNPIATCEHMAESGWRAEGALRTSDPLQEHSRGRTGEEGWVAHSLWEDRWEARTETGGIDGGSKNDRLRPSPPSTPPPTPPPARILGERAGKSGVYSRRARSWTAYRNMSAFQSSHLGALRRPWLCKTTYYF